MSPKRSWHEPVVTRLIDEAGGEAPEAIMERWADDLRAAAGQSELPVRTDLIASVAGIKRRQAPFDFSGRIFAEPSGQLVMDINESEPEERQRFTEAHELMHPAFPGFKKEHRYRSDASADRYPENREEEYLCDYGAAALLMPHELVAPDYAVRNGLSDVERLSRDANVSVEAAANRLVALSDEPAILLCLAWSHKPADRSALRKGIAVPRRLRVRYALATHLSVFVPKFKSANDGDVFTRAAAAGGAAAVAQVDTLPGVEKAGPFRIQAKSYGSDDLQRVIAVARPTA